MFRLNQGLLGLCQDSEEIFKKYFRTLEMVLVVISFLLNDYICNEVDFSNNDCAYHIQFQ